MSASYKRVHLVGVGGAGMSGIARILLARGVEVSGSDARHSRVLDALTALGGRMHVGHDPAQVATAEVVVVSTAIRPDNPEVVEARRLGLDVLPRAAALASLMVGRRAIAVAGTHGKTTTTSMLTVALQHCGVDPSFAIGGDLNEAGSNAHHGSGDIFVAEADESDGSFLRYSPWGAIVTNVEADHLDHHGDEAAVHRAFADFTALVDPSGFLVVCGDDPGAMAAADSCDARVRTYGTGESADLRIVDVELDGLGSRCEVIYLGQRLGVMQLAVPGLHNVLDAAGALAAGLELGLPAGELRDGLATFTGARRRFDHRGEAAGVRVFDDYAHHPTEVAAALHAARAVADGGAVIVAFQPHLYSRTQAFADRFGEALGLADRVVVMEVYGAREDPIPGVSGRLIADAVPLPMEAVAFEPSWLAVPALLVGWAHRGDIILTMGAGDVTQLGPEVLAALDGDG